MFAQVPSLLSLLCVLGHEAMAAEEFGQIVRREARVNLSGGSPEASLMDVGVHSAVRGFEDEDSDRPQKAAVAGEDEKDVAASSADDEGAEGEDSAESEAPALSEASEEAQDKAAEAAADDQGIDAAANEIAEEAPDGQGVDAAAEELEAPDADDDVATDDKTTEDGESEPNEDETEDDGATGEIEDGNLAEKSALQTDQAEEVVLDSGETKPEKEEEAAESEDGGDEDEKKSDSDETKPEKEEETAESEDGGDEDEKKSEEAGRAATEAEADEEVAGSKDDSTDAVGDGSAESEADVAADSEEEAESPAQETGQKLGAELEEESDSLLELGQVHAHSATAMSGAQLRLRWERANPYLTVTIKGYKGTFLSSGEDCNDHTAKFRDMSGNREVFRIIPHNSTFVELESAGTEGRYLCENKEKDTGLQMKTPGNAKGERDCVWKIEDAPNDQIFIMGYSGKYLRSDNQNVAEMDEAADKGERKQFYVALNGTVAPNWVHITSESVREEESSSIFR